MSKSGKVFLYFLGFPVVGILLIFVVIYFFMKIGEDSLREEYAPPPPPPPPRYSLAYEKAVVERDYEGAINEILRVRNDDKGKMKAIDIMQFEDLSMGYGDTGRLLLTLESISRNMDLSVLSLSDIFRLSEYCSRAGGESECVEITAQIPDDEYREILKSGWVHSVLKNDPRYVLIQEENERERKREEILKRTESQVSIILSRNPYLTRHEAEMIQSSLEQVRHLRCSQGAEWYGIPPNTNTTFPSGLAFKCP